MFWVISFLAKRGAKLISVCIDGFAYGDRPEAERRHTLISIYSVEQLQIFKLQALVCLVFIFSALFWLSMLRRS